VRSLFLRIFLSFWTATALIGASLVVLAVTADPRRTELSRHEDRLRGIGQELVEAYRSGGAEALQDLERALGARSGHPLFLLDASGSTADRLAAPPPVRRLAARVAATGEAESRPGRRGSRWLALPLGDEFVFVAEVAPPSALDRLLDPHRLAPRLGAAFLIIGVVSFLLARSLSRPIRRLREATQRLAAGDLSARVGSSVGARRDEASELGRDFDRMAARIEGLLGAQRRLLQDISHELRSPLARLRVALELARGEAAPGAGGALDRMERETERLDELIGGLLVLTRLEGAGDPARMEPVELEPLVRQVAQDADFEARGRNRSVRVIGSEAVTLAGVAELLRRAVENVVRNAVRFTAEGTAVEIRVARVPGGGEARVRVEVRDRGPGVPREALSELFRPFYRVSEARDRSSGGSGLGLAIAERAVRLHGGTVSAANLPGGGLEVAVELPCRPKADAGG
jgi:two-component system sensor histidine kinase CpxA